MQSQPTDAELKERVRRLEKTAAALREENEALRQSESLYRRLVENSPAVVFQFRMDPGGRFSFPYISCKISEVLKITAEDGMRDPSVMLDLIPREDQDASNTI